MTIDELNEAAKATLIVNRNRDFYYMAPDFHWVASIHYYGPDGKFELAIQCLEVIRDHRVISHSAVIRGDSENVIHQLDFNLIVTQMKKHHTERLKLLEEIK